MKLQTLQTDTLTLRYLRFGNPEGQALIIIPGVSLGSVMRSAGAIAQQYQSFAERFDVYLFDRREDAPAGYSIRQMAGDIVRAAEHLNLHPVDLYGVSQGGMIAQVIAEEHPALVRRIALCSTSAYCNETGRAVLTGWRDLARAGEMDALMLSFAEKVYSPAFCERFHDAFLDLGRIVTADDLRLFIIGVESVLAFDGREALGTLRAPLLILGGGNDQVFGEEVFRELSDRTGGTLHIYPDGNHAICDEEPDVLTRLLAFLQ